jgi:hypothetical protein
MPRKEIKELLNEAEKIFVNEAKLIQMESGIRLSVNRMPSYWTDGLRASFNASATN